MGLLNTVTKDRKIYGNCQVLSPEGHLMFRCESKKANWYLKRDLADIITDEPLVIKLKFQPNDLEIIIKIMVCLRWKIFVLFVVLMSS